MVAGKQFSRRMPPKRRTTKKTTRRELRELDVKISFLEGLLRRDADYVEALQTLGDHYTQRGRYEEGLKIDERLSQLEPRNALVFYNLACSYALTDRMDRAATALEQALALGFRDFHWLAKDPDLRKLRKHPLFRNIKDKILKLKIQVL
jgi:tetratricopeptide (TPR) repeat protein